ncbi:MULTISPECIES: YopX family protein [Streptococcus]|uniref:YopX family protein n=1 Tax=Streptococcus TaxID=1301 RepID=UPI00110C3645|nr:MULTISPECIES: YopX family protein [Streptococcus]TMR49639.1 hypothetical protein E3V31_10050 [Streptococcus pseudopneumoniae]
MIPKFRAWDVLSEKMIDEILMISFVRKEIIGKFSDGSTSVPLKFKDERNGEDVILMQSTGLKDKNGKEIFEGDVLEIEDEGEVLGNAKLTWDNEQAVFMIEAVSVDDIAPFHEILSDESYSYRVVGNVYENPELLEN